MAEIPKDIKESFVHIDQREPQDWERHNFRQALAMGLLKFLGRLPVGEIARLIGLAQAGLQEDGWKACARVSVVVWIEDSDGEPTSLGQVSESIVLPRMEWPEDG